MSFIQKLFGRKNEIRIPQKAKDPTFINQDETGPPLKVDTASITHAFVALTTADRKHSKKVEDQISDLNRNCQPELWTKQFKAKYVTFACNPIDNGFPDPEAVRIALESVGISSYYSVVINLLTISFDAGKTPTKILAGFAYTDHQPKTILPRNNGCIPQ